MVKDMNYLVRGSFIRHSLTRSWIPPKLTPATDSSRKQDYKQGKKPASKPRDNACGLAKPEKFLISLCFHGGLVKSPKSLNANHCPSVDSQRNFDK